MVSKKERSTLLNELLFPKVFRAFNIAVQPSKLIISFSALAVICIAGWLMDFSRTVIATPGTQGRTTELQAYMTDPGRVAFYIETFKQRGERTGVFRTLWHFGAAKFHGALKSLFALDLKSFGMNVEEYFRGLGWAVKYHPLYCILFILVKLAVISVAGGAICRIAALQIAQGERPGLTEALRFSTRKFTTFFATPLVPAGLIVGVGLVFISSLGLMGNIPRAGELIVGAFVLLALIAGALIAVFLIGTLGGLNLMFPAIAYDGSDCLDAISSSFHYVFAKPWRMGFYSAMAAIYGAVCYVFVRLFAFLMLWITHTFLRLSIWSNNSTGQGHKLETIWPKPSFGNLLGSPVVQPTNWSESIAAYVIHLFVLAVVGLVVSFIISFYFSANTIIYALMRNRVDNTAIEDVYVNHDEAEGKLGITDFQDVEAQQERETEQESSS
jgi:hypothetical protein